MTHIAFLGTGLLGGALAEAAAKRGEKVSAWNRTAEKARALEQFGVKAADTPGDAVRGAARVHLVLKDDAVVEDVIAQARPGLAWDTVILDHSTTLPHLTAERSQRLNGAGVHYLHCPVFIGPAAARAGQGTVLVAGPSALYETVKDALARMAPKVEYLGERPDLAAINKLCGNAFIIGMCGLIADVYSVAAGSNIPAQDALRVIQFFDPSGIIAGRGKSMLAQNFAPSFELAMARKDVGLMIDAAGTRPLATLPGLAARMDALIADGEGAKDLAVMGRDAVSPAP